MISVISSTNSYSNMWQVQQSSSSSSSSSTENIFSKIDTDGDGSVSKEEFDAFQTEMQAQFKSSVTSSQYDTTGTTSSTEDIFSKIDTDGDGSVSKEEFDTFRSEMEAQKNGTVTGTTSATDDLFSKIDADGDGSVSESELDDFQKQMQAMGPPPHPPKNTSAASATDSNVSALLQQALNQYQSNQSTSVAGGVQTTV